MKILNELKLYLRCGQMLECAREYKTKNDPRYYMAYHSQIRLYADLKKGLTNSLMINSLSRLEQEVLP